jgi:hypothetical protein
MKASSTTSEFPTGTEKKMMRSLNQDNWSSDQDSNLRIHKYKREVHHICLKVLHLDTNSSGQDHCSCNKVV